MKIIQIVNSYSWGWHLSLFGIGFPYPRIPTRTSALWRRRFGELTQDELVRLIDAQYYDYNGKKMNWDNPTTFLEKINWLKAFYHDPMITICADKVRAREFFLQTFPEKENCLVRQIGVYDQADEIDFSSFPSAFVLKSNWGSGAQIIVKDKANFAVKKAKHTMSWWTNPRSNHYYDFFEWGYKNIQPKIVAEEFLQFNYKLEFFCFNGQPRFFWVVLDDKTKNTRANFYELDWKLLPISNHYPNFTGKINRPQKYAEMLDVARKLCADFPFVRCDFYVTDEGYRFSEMTFYHWGGYCEIVPDKYDQEWGKWLTLPDPRP